MSSAEIHRMLGRSAAIQSLLVGTRMSSATTKDQDSRMSSPFKGQPNTLPFRIKMIERRNLRQRSGPICVIFKAPCDISRSQWRGAGRPETSTVKTRGRSALVTTRDWSRDQVASRISPPKVAPISETSRTPVEDRSSNRHEARATLAPRPDSR